jgi:RimJ/RimL family protein N-acetyltransferase
MLGVDAAGGSVLWRFMIGLVGGAREGCMRLLMTPRLELRAWGRADLEAFFDLYRRWEVARWLGAQPRSALTDLDEARDRLARWHERGSGLAPPFGLWAMVPRAPSGSVPVGTVLLLPLADATGATEEVEVGWHLHPDWQGRGLATEAAAALLSAATVAGFDRVRALTDPDNVASQAVARRLGMVDAGLTDRWFGLTLCEFVRAPGTGDRGAPEG